MNDHIQLREQMWDLVYGLATPAETAALHARITSDPVVARLYAEVRLEADLIAQAARVDDASVTLPVEPSAAAPVKPQREKPAASRARHAAGAFSRGAGAFSRGAQPLRGIRVSQSLHWLAALSASALVVLLSVGTFWRGERIRHERYVYISIHQDPATGLVANVPANLHIEARDEVGKPAAARKLRAQVADSLGRTLFDTKVETDKEGKALLAVPSPAVVENTKLIVREVRERPEPADSPAPRDLERSAAVQKQEDYLIDAALPVQPEPIKAAATFDKDWYEAGESLQFRAATVTAFSLQPQDPSTLTYRLEGPDGRLWEPTESATMKGTGVIAGKFQLPADAPAGRYAFSVLGRSPVMLGEEASVLVLGKSAQAREEMLDGEAVRGGMRFKGGLSSAGSFGGGGIGGAAPNGPSSGPPAPGAGAPAGSGGRAAESRSDPRGLAMAPLPAKGAKASTAPGVAGGRVDPTVAGEPAAAASTSPSKPRLEPTDQLRAIEEKLAQADLPVEAKPSFNEHEGDELYGNQPTHALEVVVPPEFAGRPVEIEAFYKRFKLGKAVAAEPEDAARDKMAELEADGRRERTARLPLTQWVDGEELEVEFRDFSSLAVPLRIRKLIKVPSALDVGLTEAKESYAPGEKVRLMVEVKNKLDGSAVAYAPFCVAVKPVHGESFEVAQRLSKAIVDQVDLADEKQARGVRSGSVTANEREELEAELRRKLTAKDSGKSDARRDDVGMDRASKRDTPLAAATAPPAPAPPARTNDPLPAESAPSFEVEPRVNLPTDDADGSKSLESLAADATVDEFANLRQPLLISNESKIKEALAEEEAARSAQRVRMSLWRVRLGRMLLAGGVLMLLVLGVAFAAQRPAKPLVWVSALGIASASFAVGVVWVMGHPRHEMAQSTRRESNEGEAAAKSNASFDRSSESIPASSVPLLAMDSEGSFSGGAPGADAAAVQPLDSTGTGPLGGIHTDGAVPGTPDNLRQRRATELHDSPQRIDDAGAVKTKEEAGRSSGVASPANGKRPAASDNGPPAPDAAVKQETPSPSAAKEPIASPQAKRNSDKDKVKVEGGSNPKPDDERKNLNRATAASEGAEVHKNGDSLENGVLADRDVENSKRLDAMKKEKDGKKVAAHNVWQPLLVADENGRAIVEFTMPEAPGDYRLVLDVSGQGRVGQLQTTLRCIPQPAAEAAPSAKP